MISILNDTTKSDNKGKDSLTVLSVRDFCKKSDTYKYNTPYFCTKEFKYNNSQRHLFIIKILTTSKLKSVISESLKNCFKSLTDFY